MGLMHPIDQLFKWLKVFQARPEAAARALYTVLWSKATRKSTTCGNFDIILGTRSRAFSAPTPTPHCPCTVVSLLSMLIGSCLVLGIRYCDRFGASGSATSSRGSPGSASSSSATSSG